MPFFTPRPEVRSKSVVLVCGTRPAVQRGAAPRWLIRLGSVLGRDLAPLGFGDACPEPFEDGWLDAILDEIADGCDVLGNALVRARDLAAPLAALRALGTARHA